ncbi:hypothetical protein DUNSADRAFT_14554 [Dunaliella salina]|uniref:Encoded protein n=1 Tax=Dunaliella salina TaxID=3046 RepID=A0ABQ7G771_DUNSA|nr:hypothetical protein DUNSADRAFT_14554 [Dunaliella salina]|eukprot:KAF5830457.1 hypothetical protein DUNSADRAFT_14554 [Dunaliella salina]
MRTLLHTTSDNARPPCTPPQKSKSLSGRLASPVSSPQPSVKSLSGRLTPPSSASQVVPQAASTSHTLGQQVSQVEQEQSRENSARQGPQQNASSARRSLERSWSTSELGERPPICVTLPEDHQIERKPTIPAPVPVVHSSTYMKSLQSNAAAQEPEGPADIPVEPVFQLSKAPAHRRSSSTDNALEWAMCRADRNLDELERNPLPLQKAFYALSRGPVGEMTSSAAQAAAKLTLTAGKEVTRASIPVGKWALTEGMKAAGGLIQAQRSRRGSFEQKKGKAN